MPTNDVPASQIVKNDVLRVTGWPTDATVRGIDVVLHMDNGMDLVVRSTDNVRRVT